MLRALMQTLWVALVLSASTASEPQIDYREWATRKEWQAGVKEGVAFEGDTLTFARVAGSLEYSDPSLKTTERYEYARWISPERALPFPATEIIPSWNAQTPAGTWLQLELQTRTQTGATSGWYVMARWSSDDAHLRRTTVSSQQDAHGRVSTDTFVAAEGESVTAYRLRVTLLRKPGVKESPRVWRVGAVASWLPERFEVPPSPPGVARGIELVVPRHSQSIHRGLYPEFAGGGQAWCSPTSTTMVIEYWGRGPTAEEISWVDPKLVDRQVVHAVRQTFDYDYRGAGNWPFNTAYAARYGLRGHITRLKDLNALEEYIAAGIPVITSQSFLASELDGADYGTSGHIMVVIGFTPEGDVIVNDPAGKDNLSVRRVYKRHQFETVWLRTKRRTESGKVAGGPGGTVYVIQPAAEPKRSVGRARMVARGAEP